MNVIIKAQLPREDGTVEVRRIPVAVTGQDNNNGVFKDIASKVGNAFPSLQNKRFTLKWKDSDGDLVVMSTDEEMLEAIGHAENQTLKLFITVDGVKDTETEDFVDMMSDKGQDLGEGEGTAGEKKQDDTWEDDESFPGFMGGHFRHPPRDFGFGDPVEILCSLDGRRKRGHPDHSDPRGHHHGHDPEHHGPRDHFFGHMGPRGHFFGHMGPRGHHFDHMGPREHSFGHMGPRGHSFGHMGPRGHHFGHLGPRGHHMGMSGAFGGHGFFGGPSPSPFHHFGHHFGHHFDHHHGKRHHGKDGWKGNLRDAVPVAHRRWAKSYIRTWRVQNLTNATSTSSDSDQDAFALDTSNVPEAYMLWLETLLPKWHKRLGEETSNVKKDEAKDSASKDQLKASVPVEFRKWVKWYLARHFGKKESPKFRKHGGGHDFGGKLAKGCKKNWKRACKMQTLSVSIPTMHRMWAKIFIRDWRQEHNIPDPKSGSSGTVSSESEETETETAKGDITIPNDYVRWMRKFLARWHLWRGETTDKVQIEKGGMGEFKDTVPRNFRKWVKCFLWRRYGNGLAKEVDTANQYQKWLQAFQKKWLQDQEKGSSADELVLSSSDEEASNQTTDVDTAEKSVETSLKKLRLEGEENVTRNVHFDPSTEGVARERVPRTDNSPFGDFEGALFNKKTNPGFRQWASEALWQWDGKTASSTEGAASNEQIPPHVYHWMYKVMTKVQMKKMKQDLKQAKQAMKAAKKAQK